MADDASGVMPLGQMTNLPIRESDVQVTEGNAAPPMFSDDAVATIVWENYNKARSYVENNAWLLEWQETDIIYQSPIPNRFLRIEQGRPPRIPDFLVAKLARTMSRAVKRGLFAEQTPFFLRPKGKTTQKQVDAWTAIVAQLLKRMKFQYYAGLMIDCQVLQGTSIGKVAWKEKTVIKKRRKRKHPVMTPPMPDGSKPEVPTKDSDTFVVVAEEVIESWPVFEYRRLGTTLFDPKWSTPDMPDETAGYVVDVDYVNFDDLAEMREMECYENIPDEETLKRYFFSRQEHSAPVGSQIEDSMSSQGSMVAHAEARNVSTDTDPTKQELMIIEQWDTRTTKTILHYDGRLLVIRDEVHEYNSSLHFTCTWWPIDNCGYGMGIGRIAGPDQRVRAGLKNESLKTVAYPFNAPLVYTDENNAPTQNVLTRMGGFWHINADKAGGDYRKAVGFLQMPEVPADAWRMLESFKAEGEQLTGADNALQQGNVGKPGSSIVRTAAGVNRSASQSDQSVADPIDSFANGVIIPVVTWLIEMVREKMPLEEIRSILPAELAQVVEKAIDEDSFLDAEMEVEVLAGQKLAARGAIQQLIPFFLQILSQPQLLEYEHQIGKTIDLDVIADLFLQVSELMQQPDIIREMTPQERAHYSQANPALAKIQAELAKEKQKGANQVQAIETKGQVDLGNKAAEIALTHAAEGSTAESPLQRAEGLYARGSDLAALRGGEPSLETLTPQ